MHCHKKTVYSAFAIRKADIVLDKQEKNKWTFQVNVKNIAMIILGALINVGGYYLAAQLKLPIWLDSVGTFLNAILLGPVAGALSGLIMNLIVSFNSPGHLWFALVSIAGGLAVGRFFPRDRKIESFSVIATALFAGFVMTIVATPLNLYFSDGFTGNAWGDALVTMMSEYISFKTVCCISGELLVEMPDKALSIVITMAIIQVMRKTKVNRDNKAVIKLILAVVLTSLVLPGAGTAKADVTENYDAEHSFKLYGVDDGLSSAEINALAQTPEGYIWAGGYSGLYRYNGSTFEKMNLDERINNVTELYVDREGMLWIGTNDSGAFRYSPLTSEVSAYTTSVGLVSDSIRSICADGQGAVYISTASELCRLEAGGGITVIEDEEIRCVYSLKATPEGFITGVTQDGVLFVADGDSIVIKEECKTEGLDYTTVAVKSDGGMLIGTTDNVFFLTEYADSELKQKKEIKADGFSYANQITVAPDNKGFLATGSKGIIHIDESGKEILVEREGFDTAGSDVIIDYQGNTWFSSSKQGIMKMSENPFIDYSKKAGLEQGVVNALLLDESTLYVGMDTGLGLIDVEHDRQIENKLTKALDKCRIRAIMKDSSGCVWISTYSNMGLVRVKPEANGEDFDTFSEGVTGNWFRFCLELSDGTVMIVTSDGLSFCKDGKVAYTMDADNGFAVPQILTAVETEDGSIMCGSDGEGVYIIKDGAVTGHIGQEEGLATQVVLKIVPARDGYIFVTSNGLYYRESNGHVRRLKSFPYNNNYDVQLMDGSRAWVTSSAGIYVAELDRLIADEDLETELLNRYRGFDTTLTANAWNIMDGDMYYLCCTDGVRRINTKTFDEMQDDFNIVLADVSTDGEKIKPVDGVYNIPSGKGRTVIRPAVLNYTTTNLMIRIEMEGKDDVDIKVHQTELSDLQFPNLSYGDYTLKISVIDELTGAQKKVSTFELHKDSELYERFYYKLYLVFVGGMLVAFLAWMFAKMGNMAVINRQYEQIREAKEEAELANQAKSRFLANMSHEIRTPINAVLGMDEMILRESSEPGIRGYAEDIYTAGNTLLSLINDILDSSKIESGKMEIVPVEYELATLIRDLVNMIQKRALDKDLLLVPEIDETLPSVLFGDDVRIRQVLTNMLTNAVKYTPEGTVWLRMSGKKEGNELLLHCEVADTGMGIKEEDLPKLFEAFQRIEEGRNRNIEGTGLGMNITTQLLSMMNSKLEVESEYGKGSRFWFDIRQGIVSDKPVGDPLVRESGAAEGYSYEGAFIAPDASVLVVDDNDMNRKVFRSLLKPLRMKISEAAGGREALMKAEAERYDLVFLDHMMPDMDGIETLHEMRKLAGYDAVPIYVLTANAVSGAKELYLEEGFDGFISKPIVSSKLEQAIRDALPPEKLKSYEPSDEYDGVTETISSSEDEEKARVLEKLPDVDGLDWEYAWLHIPYEDVLGLTINTFRETIDSQADKLDKMYADMCEAADDDSMQAALKEYRILVHSMKGSSAMLGIVPLAGMAKMLEYAARDKETERIKSLHGTFITEWRSYKEKLKGVFATEDEAENIEAKEAADEGMTLAMLAMLEQAMDDFDVDAADEVAGKLASYSYDKETAELIEKLVAAVKNLDQYEAFEITERIKAIIG